MRGSNIYTCMTTMFPSLLLKDTEGNHRSAMKVCMMEPRATPESHACMYVRVMQIIQWRGVFLKLQ